MPPFGVIWVLAITFLEVFIVIVVVTTSTTTVVYLLADTTPTSTFF